MKDTATDAAKNLASAMVKQSFDAAGETLKKAAAVPGAVAKTAASTVQKAASVAAGVARAPTPTGPGPLNTAAAPKPAPRKRSSTAGKR
jgi:hypothetical protein